MEIYILFAILLISLFLRSYFHEILYHTKKERVFVMATIFVVMMGWEFMSKAKNVWVYPGDGMVGWYPFGLPIELYLFYLILPYFCFVVYELIRKKIRG